MGTSDLYELPGEMDSSAVGGPQAELQELRNMKQLGEMSEAGNPLMEAYIRNAAEQVQRVFIVFGSLGRNRPPLLLGVYESEVNALKAAETHESNGGILHAFVCTETVRR